MAPLSSPNRRRSSLLFFKNMKTKVIAVDFDGTIVHNIFPNIGEPLPLAFETIKELQQKGNKVILLTMRCGETLEDCLTFCEDHGVVFDGVNENPFQGFLGSIKVHASLYIDDNALGCPVIKDDNNKDAVDWTKVRQILKDKGLI